MVARDAGADDVLPYMGTAFRPWNDVVESQVLGLAAAVLALEAVPVEDRSARQSASHQRALYHVHESDYRRHLYEQGDSTDVAATVVDDKTTAVIHLATRDR